MNSVVDVRKRAVGWSDGVYLGGGASTSRSYFQQRAMSSALIFGPTDSIAVLQNTAGDARERLLAAAFEIAIRDGVDAVSTRAVCTAAGVQAPSLYHHFGDRSGLIRAVVDVAFEEYFHRKDTAPPVDDADPRARVAAGWDALIHALVAGRVHD